MKTLTLDLFKAQNVAPRKVFQTAMDIVNACRVAGYVREFDGNTAIIRWPFAGPAEDRYEVLESHGMPKSCMKLTK